MFGPPIVSRRDLKKLMLCTTLVSSADPALYFYFFQINYAFTFSAISQLFPVGLYDDDDDGLYDSIT